MRPNSGLLAPGESTQIAICLQPFIYDPAEKNKHKFMVQTVFCEQENVNIETFWKEVTPEMLMDSKLRCVFEVPAQEQTRVGASGAETATFHNVSNNETHKAAQDGDVGDSLELQKATAEIQRLRQIESELRKEMLRVKDEKMGLLTSKTVAPQNRYAPPVDQPNTLFVVAIAVVVGLVGLLLGKFVL